MDNNTAGVCEREVVNCTREAGNRDEVEGVVANTLNLYRNGAVGFIDWLGGLILHGELKGEYFAVPQAVGVPKANLTNKFNNPWVGPAASRRGRRP